MKIFCLLLTIFFTSNRLMASETKTENIFVAIKTLPHEFRLLIESVQQYQMTSTEKKNLKRNFSIIDKNLSIMSHGDIHFLIKSEIYKIFLNEKLGRNSKIKHTTKLLEILRGVLHENKKRYSPFALWLIEAVKADLERLTNSSPFKQLLQRKKSGKRIIEKNLRDMQNKLYRILPVAHNVVSSSPEEFHDQIKSQMFKLVKKIAAFCTISNKLSNMKKTKSGPLIFFHIRKKQVTPTKISAIDRILDYVLSSRESKKTDNHIDHLTNWIPRTDPDYISPKKLPAPVSDWFETQKDDSNYEPPTNLPKTTSDWFEKPIPTQEYISPKQLPEAISDWFESPALDPGYIPPLTLPGPVNDWFHTDSNKTEIDSKNMTAPVNDPDKDWVIN